MTTSSDGLIFAAPKIVVSKTIVRVGSTSYPINGIGSVHIRKAKTGGAISGAIIFALGAIWTFWDYGEVATIPAAISAACWCIALNARSVLILRTASGDQQALKSRDVSFLTQVQEAIEEAVVQRG